ncbi:glycosyltransferase [Massilia arenosa]|uniref:Glycosyltransferase n=1 Tax=Zemynaea arenosa TaxID=2561931 RepID=A0A4Y9SHI6_9BURK|nr:glycosyltransferase [Massilia arenosa]TFW21153.1 glycosyltransferase [Massilia arenosa]
MTEPRPFRLLQLVPEALPSFRADVATLFGKYLPRHAVLCDIVGKAGQGELDGHAFASARRPPKHGKRWRNELAFAGLCLRAAWTADKRACDVLQVRDMVSIGLLVLLIARLRGMRFAYWVSFLISEGRIERARSELARRRSLHYTLVLWKGLVERWLLYKIVLPRADAVFVQSDAMLDRMAARGIARSKMYAVPMGVDTEKLGLATVQGRRRDGWDGIPVLAYLGTLDSSRHIDKVLDALHLLRTQLNWPTARLLLIGDSPTPSDVVTLRAHAAALGLADAIHITGWLPSEQALPLLAGADAAISYIPRGDLFDISSPTKLLEYLALAMPCVGNDTPDQVHVLSKSQAGWLTESTPQAMAEGVAAIFADRPAARAKAAKGPQFIEQNRSYRVLAAGLAERYRQMR